LKPNITEGTGSFTFQWDNISIKVSRIKMHRDGRIVAELHVTTDAKNYNPHLHQATYNLTSATTMKQLTKLMAEKYPEGEWDSIIEQLCFYTLERMRTGEDVVELDTETEAKPPEYLIYPILPKNQPTIIFGDPGVCKSELSQLLAICLILPWHDNPLGLEVPIKSVRPLILDYETDEDEVRWRLKCLQRGLDLPFFSIPYRRCHLPIHEDLDSIREKIDGARADVLIIDSLTAACGGDIKETSTASEFFRALRSLKMSSLIIAQTSKDTNSKMKTILGSTIFTYYARSVWEIKSSQEEGDDEITIGLYHNKANMSKRQQPLGFTFHFNEGKTLVTTSNPNEVKGLCERVSASSRIIEELRTKPKTANDLAEILELPRNTIDQASGRLRAKGVIYKTGEMLGLVRADDA